MTDMPPRVSDEEVERLVLDHRSAASFCLGKRAVSRAGHHESTADALASLLAERRALEEMNATLTAERDELRRRLGGGCDANDGGDHAVMRDGRYTFCSACGESLTGTRYSHASRSQVALAALRTSAPEELNHG